MLLLLKAAESVARLVGTEKKPLRVFDKMFCGAQIAIPRSGVISYLQSLDGYPNKDGLDYISLSTNLCLVHEYSGYTAPIEEESSQRTHRRKKKVNKGRWTKDEVRMSICKQRCHK